MPTAERGRRATTIAAVRGGVGVMPPPRAAIPARTSREVEDQPDDEEQHDEADDQPPGRQLASPARELHIGTRGGAPAGRAERDRRDRGHDE
jgi:hypothetical protein